MESETQVTNPIPSLVNPTPPLMSVKVVSMVTSSLNPTPPLTSTKVVDMITSSVNPTPPLTSDKVTNLILSSVNPTLPLKSVKVFDPIPSSINPTLPLEIKTDYAHVFLVDTGSPVPRGNPPSPARTPPHNEAILFDWAMLTRPRAPSHMPFNITVKYFGRDIPQMLIDEGSSVSIFSSISLQYLGYPQLVSVTQTLSTFNRRTNHPLGILPRFTVTLGGKTVFIDIMVVQDPLDFDLLLGRDYVYAMKFIVSTLFHVIYFPHDGRMVTIDQILFVGPYLTINPMTSLNESYMQSISPFPWVNYVALCPMTSTSDDLDLVVHMVISSVGLLELDLLTPNETLDMCSFQSILLPSSEDLLEVMTKFCPLTWCPSRVLFSCNP
jgi:hypothetical protein